MTPPQKNYFTWLVLRNAETIAIRANTIGRGTAVINKAFDKFKALGLSVVPNKSPMTMRRESIEILGRLLGVKLTVVQRRSYDEDEDEETFGFDLEEPF